MDMHFLFIMVEVYLLRSIKNPDSLAKIKPFCKDLYDAMKTAFVNDPDFN